jgi:hypothetical protein
MSSVLGSSELLVKVDDRSSSGTRLASEQEPNVIVV